MRLKWKKRKSERESLNSYNYNVYRLSQNSNLDFGIFYYVVEFQCCLTEGHVHDSNTLIS